MPSECLAAARKRQSSSRGLTIVLLMLSVVSPYFAQKTSVGSVPVSELVARGKELLRNRNPKQARKVLEEAVNRDPKSAVAWSLLADTYLQLGLEEKAIQGSQTTLGLRPDEPDALYNLGILFFNRQQFEDAVRYLQAYRKQRPEDQQALLPLAQSLLQLRRLQEAIPLLEEALRGQGAAKGVYLTLASAYDSSYQNDRAIEVLYSARNLWPKDEEVRSAMTRELMGKNDPFSTLTQLRARENEKLLPADLLLLAGCYASMRRLEEARKFAEQAVAGGEGEPALLALANILQLEGRNFETIRLLEPRKNEFSSSAKYLFTLGLSYYNSGNYSGARDLFTKAIALNPSLAQAHYLKGNSLARLGSPELALVEYEEAVRLAPDKFLYQYQLGLVLSNVGKKDQAEEHLKQSVELNRSYAPARYELARIYSETSRDNQAREQLEAAIKADSSYLSSFYLLSQVYRRLGRQEDASRVLEQFQAMQRQQHQEERALIQANPRGDNP